MSGREFIKKLPSCPIKQTLAYIYGVFPLSVKYGKLFWETRRFLQESQWWSKERLEEYQMCRLSELLDHAYENVPYYQMVFNERGLKPKDIQDFDDLRQIPYLTKDVIRNNFNELIAKNIPKSNLKIVRTSGSTGKPLSFYRDRKRTDSLEQAFIETLWNRVGYRSTYKKVDLTWAGIENRNALWNYNPAYKTLVLSPFQMREENLEVYVKKIKEFRPRAIKAIPSTIVVLADFVERNQIKPFPTVEVILLGSEMLYPWQRSKIKEVFNCRIYSWYGQSEQVVLAGECEISEQYHVFSEYGVLEIIDRNGEVASQEGSRGEMVGTGFNNWAMPFIRYKTGDIVVKSNSRTCACGRNYSLLGRLDGREQEFIVSRNGDLIPLLALPFSSALKDIKQFQFYQDKPGEVILKIVKTSSLALDDSDSVIKKLTDRLSNIKFQVEFVDNISRTERGKYRYMIQKIPISFNRGQG
jgi:phenylacetate-CoA ligase